MKTKLTILLMLLVSVGVGQIRVDTKTSSLPIIKLTEGATTADTATIMSKDSIVYIGNTTNASSFYRDGTMVAIGNATCYDDLMFPFTLGTNAGTGYPVLTADSGYYNFVIDTTGGSKCIIYMNLQLPHNRLLGSKIYPHLHYKYTTAQGTPTFKMKYKVYPIGSSTDFGWTWYTMSTTTGTTNNTHQICYSTNGITISNGLSAMIICQIYLTGQTGTGGINTYQFDIHYEINSLGSRTEYTK